MPSQELNVVLLILFSTWKLFLAFVYFLNCFTTVAKTKRTFLLLPDLMILFYNPIRNPDLSLLGEFSTDATYMRFLLNLFSQVHTHTTVALYWLLPTYL